MTPHNMYFRESELCLGALPVSQLDPGNLICIVLVHSINTIWVNYISDPQNIQLVTSISTRASLSISSLIYIIESYGIIC